MNIYLIIFLISYLIGSFPSAYLIVKIFTGKNILEYGTGNVGTMNTHRTTNNKLLTLLVLILDFGKGFLTYLFGLYLINWFLIDPVLGLSVAGFGLILGHNYSFVLKFKGGKGLACGAGFIFGFSPVLVFVWVMIFFLVLVLSKYMVLGQLIASAVLPLFSWYLLPNYFLVVSALSVLVVIKHAPRLKNVLDGSEPKLYYKLRKTTD